MSSEQVLAKVRTTKAVLLILMCLPSVIMGEEISHLDAISKVPNQIIKMLAEAQKPSEEGAVGRNRKQYFHVRFQYRIHHLADYAVRNREPKVAEYFIKSLEYAFSHQNDDGSFKCNIPEEFKSGHPPTRGDLASGTAFFLASAGAGALSLKQSDWFFSSVETDSLRQRLENLDPNYMKAMEYLTGERKLLESYDARAPNRLLIDALAFQVYGVYFESMEHLEIASRLTRLALEQQHEKGYFIESGGYDSSYNGVATAVGYRLLLFQSDNIALRDALKTAARWQESRILGTGEITTDGNSRVYSGGESFLGKEKRVDVSHTVEGFILAYAVTKKVHYLNLAEKIIGFYKY